MTQLSNVPMQPKPDAVERSMTLIERIQPILDDLMMECFKHGFHQKEMTEAEFIDYSRKNCVPLKREIIGILKQHSDWVSADEELPVLEHECGFRSFEPTKFYQLIDNEGGLHNAYFSTNRYANDDRALFTLCELSLYNGKWVVDDEYEVITVEMVKLWKPLQLPNWAQEKIYEQEMDKINFCGCSCILSDGLTQCSDCEALDD